MHQVSYVQKLRMHFNTSPVFHKFPLHSFANIIDSIVIKQGISTVKGCCSKEGFDKGVRSRIIPVTVTFFPSKCCISSLDRKASLRWGGNKIISNESLTTILKYFESPP